MNEVQVCSFLFVCTAEIIGPSNLKKRPKLTFNHIYYLRKKSAFIYL